MIGPIKIGVLTPYSGVYPYYGHHLMAGMLSGIYPGAAKKNEIQFIPVYTKMGDPASVLEAVNRLVFFEQADIISGLISYQSIPDIIPVIERHNKIGFFFDMGEYIPWFNYLSPRIFYCSQQIWQSQYALGNWAAKEFGDGGMMIMTIYEAGYHISNTFHKGAMDAGVNRLNMHVIPHDKNEPKKMDLADFFSKIKKNPPPYVHAIFAGSVGNDFLLQWKQSGFHKQIPLVVVENMAYDDLLEDAAALDLELYSASTWSRNDENPHNAEFVKKFEKAGGQMANVFALLGYEAGLALREIKPLIQKRDWSKISDLLQKESITGPRGERNFYPASGFALPVTDIISVKTSSKGIYKTVISQGKGLKFDSEAFKEIHEGSVSGWQNPYLCI
ncbi:ABC transporter substrate-binding protein [Mucilaginibacter sp. FT3.2]|uniref:ABC transporter substrate-binding protein n=1 Tax=Mucilaginibacter sp. FT3.2 TaxID=2723090 RepID=UPI00161C3D30|nr:ABC transporter substrate-binding protein [Mucilaginibacter sp. FT3.2]MBB6232347.1 branched-chain amino acid transport system substrate-binding protein [Mucilaginibacter sp. FT3.2]